LVNHGERCLRVEQAITVQGDLLEACRDAGKTAAMLARARGYHPLFGGDEQVHTLGKIAEAGFMMAASQQGLVPDITPFGDEFRLDCDFIYNGVAVDVKGGWVKDKADARGVPYKSFGMMVPTEKIRDSDRSEFYIYCLCWRDEDQVFKVAPVGFATRSEVKDGFVRNNVRHTCHVVPMERLHPMCELYQILAGAVPASVKEESVKCQQ
jgi:hypothetical protein